MHPWRPLPTLLLCLALGGCSHLHVDEHGQRHVLGLVWLTLPPPGAGPVGADALRLRSLGLAITRSPAGSGAVLGLSDATLTVIRNDAFVHLSDLSLEGTSP